MTALNSAVPGFLLRAHPNKEVRSQANPLALDQALTYVGITRRSDTRAERAQAFLAKLSAL
jgi:hypothetical protein